MISSTGIVARGKKGSGEWRERKRINTENAEVESTEGHGGETRESPSMLRSSPEKVVL
jgi:hypothetical protein